MRKTNTHFSVAFFFLIAFCFSLCFLSCSTKEKSSEDSTTKPLAFTQDDFVVKRGVNISHWLSQSETRGEARAKFFVESDIAFIASIGYDHVRIPVDEEQLWDEQGNKETAAFTLLHNGIQWARKYGLRVIVDLHILRSHHFNEKVKPLWTEPAAQEQFFQCWREISDELKDYSLNFVAYELMNEAVADDPEDWNRLIEKALAAVRENEPERYVVIGSNMWQQAQTFDDLRIPEDDKKIILSFHCYTPMLLTHHTASWTNIRDYAGPVHYPGQAVLEEDLEGLPEEIQEIVRDENGVYDRAFLLNLMQKPINKAKKYGLQLYCGEFGVLPTVPREDMLQWYRDMRHCCETNDIAWANWDYKGGFGIVDRDNEDAPIQDLIDVLLNEKVEE